ncbi:MAG: hypothetical protein KBF88_10860 [Polyangiaceae bacterium]|nr:hypothetical protein [Polyangiaceae bacterium]
MKNIWLLLIALPITAVLSVAGCSSDATTDTDAGTDAATTGDTSTAQDTSTVEDTSVADAATDTNTTVDAPDALKLNGCTSATYLDKTASPATIKWDTTDGIPPNTCIRIKAGSKVTWNGDLGIHPLKLKDGTFPSPIPTTPITTGTTKEITFPDVGIFGFVCENHSSMVGAIHVVP